MEASTSKMKIGKIISSSFRLVGNNALEILRIIGIFFLPIFALMTTLLILLVIITMILNGEVVYGYGITPDKFLTNSDNINYLSVIIPSALIIIVIAIMICFSYGVIIKLLSDKYCEEETSWRYSMNYVWEIKWTLLGLNILVVFMEFIFYLPLIFIILKFDITPKNIGFIMIVPIIVIAQVLLSILLMLCNSMLIVKELRVIDSIKQTIKLFSGGNFFRTIGRCVVACIITFILDLLLLILNVIPTLGIILILIGQIYLRSFFISICNLIVIEDMESQKYSKSEIINNIIIIEEY